LETLKRKPAGSRHGHGRGHGKADQPNRTTVGKPAKEKRRKRPVRDHALRSAAIATLGLLVVGFAVFVVVNSPLFSARHINVTGAGALGNDRILALAGISPATNLLKLSPGVVTDRLEQSPWIKSASVHRSFPSTITVQVTVREPVAEVKSGAKAYATIASDGTVLDASNADPGLPLIVGAPRPGAVGSRPGEYLTPAVAAGAFDVWLRDRIESLSSGRNGLVLRLHDGTLVTWGSSDDAVMKADDLEGILQWSKDNHTAVRSIDVSAPHAPAAKVAGGAVAPIPSP
jgi:cell division protein FtsQ